MVAKKVRKAFTIIGGLMEPHDSRLSADDLVSMSVQCMPSTVGTCFVFLYRPHRRLITISMPAVVPIGGFLFEYFLLTCSGYAIYREFQTCLQESRGAVLPRVKQEKWMKALSGKFVGWLLFHVACVGSNGRRQMFYMTFVNQYFGLSRHGISCLSRYGYATALTKFDEMRARCRHQSEQETRYTTS